MKYQITILNQRSKRMVLQPVRDAVEAALELEEPPPGQVNILITESDEIRRLNKEFRGLDKTTDVLSFPAPEFPAGFIGDVAVNFDHAQIQAKHRKVRPVDELAMLAVHGVLHLLGYDDETESDRAKMQSRMNEVMAKCKLPTEESWTSLPYPEEETVR